MSTVEGLKKEANELFSKREYTAALDKYIEASNAEEDENSDLSMVIELNKAACFLALKEFNEVVDICEKLLLKGDDVPRQRREKTIYRLISAYIGMAENEDGVDEVFSSLQRARALLDVEGAPTGTLHVSLQSRVFTVAKSMAIKLKPPGHLNTTTYVPPRDGQPPFMLLIILHGFGDGSSSLTKLARGMQLPGVACLVLQGPGRLPPELLPTGSYGIGYYWYDNIDLETGEPLTRGNNVLTTSCESSLRALSSYIKDVLIGTVGWESWEIAFLGIGQGGTFAVESGRSFEMELAGLFAINPDELVLACPVSRRCSQRVVLVHGKRDEMPLSSVKRIARELESEGDRVELHELSGKAFDVLKDSHGEGEVLMRFIAARLAAIRMRNLGAEEVN